MFHGLSLTFQRSFGTCEEKQDMGGVQQENNDNIACRTLCFICGAFSQETRFGWLSCLSCCAYFRGNIETGASTKFVCYSSGQCRQNRRVKDCSKCRFDYCLDTFSKYTIEWNRTDQETLVDFRDRRRIQSLLIKYDNVCTEWQFADIPFAHNGNFNWTVMINDFTVVLRRLTGFALTVKEFRHLKTVKQCNHLQESILTLLILQCGLFIYENNQGLTLAPIQRENSNILVGLLQTLFSQEDFTVCRNFLNRLCELGADRCIFVILTRTTIILLEMPCKSSVKLNINYVNLLGTWIRFKYKDPGSACLINFYFLKAPQEFQEVMQKSI